MIIFLVGPTTVEILKIREPSCPSQCRANRVTSSLRGNLLSIRVANSTSNWHSMIQSYRTIERRAESQIFSLSKIAMPSKYTIEKQTLLPLWQRVKKSTSKRSKKKTSYRISFLQWKSKLQRWPISKLNSGLAIWPRLSRTGLSSCLAKHKAQVKGAARSRSTCGAPTLKARLRAWLACLSQTCLLKT